MDYKELREIVKTIIPRRHKLEELEKARGLVKEKGRKVNYKEFSFEKGEFTQNLRLLNTEEINSFLEVSLRAAHCPMPLNADVWDGLRCGYGCRYCLPSGTKIRMYDGSYKVIERIRKGDRIISYNLDTNQNEISEVTNIMSRSAKELIRIRLLEDEKTKIKVSPEHPIFTKRGWIHAEDLIVGDEVLIW
jgi:hypothetical protein